jgi:hypothetical protein
VSEPAAFKATYSEWKLIKTRQVVQVVFEVPLKDHDEAYQALGGMPDPAAERWFGIVRLSNLAGEPASSATREAGIGEGDPTTPASRPRKPVAADKRLAQQAGIACSDELFRKFLREHGCYECDVADDAAKYVRKICGVASRSEIKVGTPEGEEWQKLYGEFLVWRDAPEMSDCQGERV